VQLRDDLLSMLVAGHETTGSVLTWTIYLLSKVLLECYIACSKLSVNQSNKYVDCSVLHY
jgi:hypothetical protein